MIETDSTGEAVVIIGIIRATEAGTTLEVTGIEVEVKERTVRTKRVHMTGTEVRIEITVEDLGGVEESGSRS